MWNHLGPDYFHDYPAQSPGVVYCQMQGPTELYVSSFGYLSSLHLQVLGRCHSGYTDFLSYLLALGEMSSSGTGTMARPYIIYKLDRSWSSSTTAMELFISNSLQLLPTFLGIRTGTV